MPKLHEYSRQVGSFSLIAGHSHSNSSNLFAMKNFVNFTENIIHINIPKQNLMT